MRSVGVVLAGGVALLASGALCAEPIGVIKRAQGDVRIERSGEHLAANRGTLVHWGDRLITGPNAHATLTLRRSGPVTLGPQNDVVVDRFAADERPTVTRPAPPILQGLASFFAVNRKR